VLGKPKTIASSPSPANRRNLASPSERRKIKTNWVTFASSPDITRHAGNSVGESPARLSAKFAGHHQRG
jgi:hypothetical protein